MKFKKVLNYITFILVDAVIIALSYIFSIGILKLLGGTAPLVMFFPLLFIIIFVKLLINKLFGVYDILVRYIDIKGVTKIVLLIFITNTLIVILLELKLIPEFMNSAVFIFITSFEVLGLVGYRIIGRILNIYERYSIKRNLKGKNTLIIGAGSAGELALKELGQNKELTNNVVGILDDDKSKQGKRIHGIAVLGPISDVKLYIKKFNIEEIIFAINNMKKAKINDLLNMVSKLDNVTVKKLSIMSDYKEEQSLKITDVKVEDLLDRDEIVIDNAGLLDFIKDEVVLITGGGGSIGSELARQIIKLAPKQLVIFDIYENNAYHIQMELKRMMSRNSNIKTDLVVLIGSVYNEKRIEEVFKTYQPNLVFHAAAYKHVPLMEDSPVEAIRTNVIGTNNVAKLASKYNVKKMVLVSSDKAVRSTNVMGATKRYAELIIGYYGENNKTKYSSVRFGNVLGSNGSVIPLFKKQIEDGGPLLVTNREITRFFMTIPEAVGLILQSAVYANGSETFVLDMGKPVKIYDLAINMIKLSGLKPYTDIDIEIIGLRPGEKLYEELLVDHNNNNILKTAHSRIFVEKTNTNSCKNLKLDYVIKNFESFNNNEIKQMLKEIIPSYKCEVEKI